MTKRNLLGEGEFLDNLKLYQTFIEIVVLVDGHANARYYFVEIVFYPMIGDGRLGSVTAMAGMHRMRQMPFDK